MTRVVHIDTCEQCPWSVGSRGCRHPNALWDDEGIIRIKVFNDYFVIPEWCPLEQEGPDWRPPAKEGLAPLLVLDKDAEINLDRIVVWEEQP